MASEIDDQGSGWFAANRANWDERVPIHLRGEFYEVAGFLAVRDTLRPFEVEEVGEVAGKTLIHLQCHFGLDTLSWARRGARVTGVDFSAPAVEEARKLADRLDLAAEFLEANVYDAASAVEGRTFDVVYTGIGALNWLPDIPRWAGVVAELLRPGGLLYLAEFHPITDVFGDEDLTPVHDYFREEPYVWDEPGTYADPEAETANNTTYEWTHTLSEVVNATVDAGLTLELLREHDYTLFPRWPFLEKSGFDTYRLPEGTPGLPLMYSLRARKPPAVR
jgi:SAM-dependent methyltransferase